MKLRNILQEKQYIVSGLGGSPPPSGLILLINAERFSDKSSKPARRLANFDASFDLEINYHKDEQLEKSFSRNAQ